MALVESLLKKALSLTVGWLPHFTRKAEAALVADHAPIAGATHVGADGGTHYRVRLAVAPNHSPVELPSSEFVDRAYDLAEAFFAGTSFRTEYSGPAEVRVIGNVGDASASGFLGSDPLLRIFPSGLVFLQWTLEVAQLPDSGEPQLSLDDIVEPMRRLYDLAHSPQFAATHVRRRLVRRRLDWRVGVTASIQGDRGPVFWRSLSSSTLLPDKQSTGQRPHCPFHEGYGAAAMLNRKPSDSLVDTYRAALQDLFTSTGYSGRIAQAADAALGARLSSQLPGSPTREITTLRQSGGTRPS